MVYGVWLVENGLCSFFTTQADQMTKKTKIRSEEKKRKGMKTQVPRSRGIHAGTQARRENKHIKQDLPSRFTMQGEQFKKWGICKETCRYLSCGYLEKPWSPLQGRLVFQIRGIKKNQNDFKGKPEGAAGTWPGA
jgi:hypothetical protein